MGVLWQVEIRNHHRGREFSLHAFPPSEIILEGGTSLCTHPLEQKSLGGSSLASRNYCRGQEFSLCTPLLNPSSSSQVRAHSSRVSCYSRVGAWVHWSAWWVCFFLIHGFLSCLAVPLMARIMCFSFQFVVVFFFCLWWVPSWAHISFYFFQYPTYIGHR